MRVYVGYGINYVYVYDEKIGLISDEFYSDNIYVDINLLLLKCDDYNGKRFAIKSKNHLSVNFSTQECLNKLLEEL